jgi:hypothetical protein
MTGEASPSYVYTPMVPEKLYRTFPHARLILLVREPVQRAYSRVAHAISLRYATFPVTHTHTHTHIETEIYPRVITARHRYHDVSSIIIDVREVKTMRSQCIVVMVLQRMYLIPLYKQS